jgi:hypothetical protein
MLLRAGDIMDDDIGETRVKQETIKVAAHFRFIDQFFGLLGSFSESHVTRFGSLTDLVDFFFSNGGDASTSCSYRIPPRISS